MTKRVFGFIAVVIFLTGFGHLAMAETLVWEFSADEQQIKNGPEPDGSTNSPGTGSGRIEYDKANNSLSYSLSWEGLFGDLTKLHLHGPAGENSSNSQHVFEIFGPPELPAELATTSGSWSDSLELQTLVQDGFDPLSPSQVIEIMESGQAYLNVHTTVFGMGEIRGNLGVPIPEPTHGIAPLISVGLIYMSCRRREAIRC